MELYIVRHGRTYWNAEGKLQGQTDIDLTSEGREAAGKLGEELDEISFDLIFSSPLIRAYETASLIRGHRNIEIRRDNRLKEISFGEQEGKDYFAWKDDGNPYNNFFNAPESYGPPVGGETLASVVERAGEFVRDELIPIADKCERVLVVAHGCLNSGLMTYLEQRDLNNYWGPGLQHNCEASIYDFSDGKWTRLK